MQDAISSKLIQALQNPALYDHPVQSFTLIETHISWVLLTGSYAYKIKKPVDLGFLDFSTLESRRHYCEQELRLNRRLAPQLYLEVMAITGKEDAPVLNGSGPAIEFAVKMVEFPQEAQLDRVLARGELESAHIDALARVLADFHSSVAIANQDSRLGSPEQVLEPVKQNFIQIMPHLTDTDEIRRLERLHNWSILEFKGLHTTLQTRKEKGFIRECHGDMHLGNMALLNEKITIFDCLEFNEELRWIDVMSEIAFVFMDLYDRDRPGLAHRLLNAYLQHTGDYAGLRVLRFYLVYRALVRTKVACIRMDQTGISEEERRSEDEHYHKYLLLAERFTRTVPTPLIITHGLSGSGKTTITDTLLETSGAIRVRSDVERKRLFGLAPGARGAAEINQGLYSADASQRTYLELSRLARLVIESGYPVIVDAAFLKRSQRQLIRDLAHELAVPFVVFDCNAPVRVLRDRIMARLAAGHDPSDADLQVLEHQLNTQEPLSNDEAKHIFSIDTSGDGYIHTTHGFGPSPSFDGP